METMTNWTVESINREPYENALYTFALSLIITCSVIGNVAVILATARTPKLKSQVANLFLINLAVTDLSNSIFVMLPSAIALISDRWIFGQFACQLQCALNYLFIIVSMLTLSFIGIDRYFAIVYSLRYVVLIKKKYVVMMIAYTWFQGSAFAVVPMGMNWIHYDYWEMVCAIDWFINIVQIIVYVVVANALCFLIPGAIIVFTYSKIIGETKRLKTRIYDAANHQFKQTLNATKTITSLLVIVIVFFICMTPFCFTKLFKAIFYADVTAVPGHLNAVSTIVQHTASATNPLIYGIFRKDFRSAFKRQLQTFGLFRDRHVTTSSSGHLSEAKL